MAGQSGRPCVQRRKLTQQVTVALVTLGAKERHGTPLKSNRSLVIWAAAVDDFAHCTIFWRIFDEKHVRFFQARRKSFLLRSSEVVCTSPMARVVAPVSNPRPVTVRALTGNRRLMLMVCLWVRGARDSPKSRMQESPSPFAHPVPSFLFCVPQVSTPQPMRRFFLPLSPGDPP